MDTLFYSPGQVVTLYLETKDGYGVREDTNYLPYASRLLLPSFITSTNFPQNMTRIDTGLYYIQFTLPSGGASVGTYLLDIVYLDILSGLNLIKSYQIIVTAPFGLYSLTTN
jgi:hypothetical protein